MEDAVAPWWANNPGLDVVRSGVLEWLDSAPAAPLTSHGPDLVDEDYCSGASWRELAEAHSVTAPTSAQDRPVLERLTRARMGMTRVERLNPS